MVVRLNSVHDCGSWWSVSTQLIVVLHCIELCRCWRLHFYLTQFELQSFQPLGEHVTVQLAPGAMNVLWLPVLYHLQPYLHMTRQLQHSSTPMDTHTYIQITECSFQLTTYSNLFITIPLLRNLTETSWFHLLANYGLLNRKKLKHFCTKSQFVKYLYSVGDSTRKGKKDKKVTHGISEASTIINSENKISHMCGLYNIFVLCKYLFKTIRQAWATSISH